MRMTLITFGLIAASGVLAFSSPGAAQGFGQVTFGAAPGTPDPKAAKPAGNNIDSVTVTGKKVAAVDLNPSEVLCHSESVMGSLFPKKVCASRREIAERRANDRQVAQEFQRSAIVGKQP
jgi:hypothetical protein